MDSKEQSGEKVPVKESIKYVYSLIKSLGVTGISTKNLRLAKFNSMESPRCLLLSLHSILTLVTKSCDPSLASSTTSSSSWKEQLALQMVLAALESVCEALLDADILGVVKFFFALWRYPPHSPLFTLHSGTHDSRHFLVALGWVLSRCNLIERALKCRLQPLLATRNAALLPHNYPFNMSSCPEALARAKLAEWVALDHMQRIIATTDRVEDQVLRMEMRADQVLLLHGQVRARLNAIQALQKTKVKKMHELHLAQLVAGEKQTQTHYQLHLLQHRNKLDLHCHAIAAARVIEEETNACLQHENLFWQWMESVANEALVVRTESLLERSSAVNLTGVTKTELLPAVEHWKWKPAPFKPRMESETSSPSALNSPKDAEIGKTTLSLGNDLTLVDSGPGERCIPLQHGKDIANFLLRQPIFVYEPTKRPEIRNVKVTLRNEENDPSSFTFRMHRIMKADEMVKLILTRTIFKNKHVVSKVLKSILEDKIQ